MAMRKDRKAAMTCKEFEAMLPKLLEGADIEDVMRHPHARECAPCTRLLEELRVVSQEAERRWDGRNFN
jgi:hypothetical protein